MFNVMFDSPLKPPNIESKVNKTGTNSSKRRRVIEKWLSGKRVAHFKKKNAVGFCSTKVCTGGKFFDRTSRI